jgi:hypothetical protein
MCRRITCRSCGKPSFAGCGEHVESVLGDVPVAQRCACAPAARADDLTAAARRVWNRFVGGRKDGGGGPAS